MPAGFFLAIGACLLLSLAIFDLRLKRLPDGLNALLGLSGAAFHWSSETVSATPAELALGAAIGGGLFYVMRVLYLRLRGTEALGLGDVKFMAAAGLWAGIWGIAPLILIAALSTLLVVVFRQGRALADAEFRRRRIPFGPGLVFGLVVVVAAQLNGFWTG
jgi:leader peptidase (prepilin peptidase)/N-methyltransferase